MNIGNSNINPNACTEAEQRQNWVNVDERLVAIEGGGTNDTYKVQVNAGDTVAGGLAGPDYLYAKVFDTGSYNGATDQVVKAEVKDSGGVRYVRLFTAQSGGTATYQVKSSAGDGTAEYLHDALASPIAPATFDINADLVVSNETTTSGGNEKELLYVQASAITDYTGTGEAFLMNVDGVTRWVDKEFAAEYITSVFIDLTAETPVFRRFELTATKLTTDATATAKFLDDAGAFVGAAETLYDPMQKFYGKAANYVTGQNGFRGIAMYRRDLSNVEPVRWEIVEMEGYADWVVLTYAGSPDNEWQLTSYGGTKWNWKPPVATGSEVTLSDPLNMVGAPSDGDTVIAVISNPDTNPPTYQEREVSRPTGESIIVKISGTVSGRSGATAGSGDAQPVDSDLNEYGGVITVYNLSMNSINGSVTGGAVYAQAKVIDGKYFLDYPDLRGIQGFADNQYMGAQGGLPLWRAFETGTPGVTGDGSGSCNGDGGVDISIDVTVTGGPFVVPPT